MHEQRNCPYCNTLCDADWVDVGVGFVQCGPYHCEACGASEISSYDKDRSLSDKEKDTGWYSPGSEPGSSANVINGKIVSAAEMLRTYKNEMTNDPFYEYEGYVEDWFKRIRNGF